MAQNGDSSIDQTNKYDDYIDYYGKTIAELTVELEESIKRGDESIDSYYHHIIDVADDYFCSQNMRHKSRFDFDELDQMARDLRSAYRLIRENALQGKFDKGPVIQLMRCSFLLGLAPVDGVVNADNATESAEIENGETSNRKFKPKSKFKHDLLDRAVIAAMRVRRRNKESMNLGYTEKTGAILKPVVDWYLESMKEITKLEWKNSPKAKTTEPGPTPDAIEQAYRRVTGSSPKVRKRKKMGDI